MKKTHEETVKAFGMTNMLIESDIKKIEKKFDVNLRQNNKPTEKKSGAYYPQFDIELRKEASYMASQYELFYCLETSIRTLISDIMVSAEGEEWWNSDLIPKHIKDEVKKRIKREKESGITPRSSDPIDYTTFGELGELIKTNWPIFGSVFNNLKAVEKIMFNLNTLRNPIAHCSPLAEDEILRLELSLRDWFRIMD